MLLNRRNGQSHLVRYLDDRFLVDTTENEGAATLPGQRIDQRL